MAGDENQLIVLAKKTSVGAHSLSHRGEQQSAHAWIIFAPFCGARFIRKIYESVCAAAASCVCGGELLVLVALKRFMCNSIFSGAQHTHCAERESAKEQRVCVLAFCCAAALHCSLAPYSIQKLSIHKPLRHLTPFKLCISHFT